METLPKLTPTQALLLRAAARRTDGRVIPPDNLRGGARAKTLLSHVHAAIGRQFRSRLTPSGIWTPSVTSNS